MTKTMTTAPAANQTPRPCACGTACRCGENCSCTADRRCSKDCTCKN